MMKLSLEEAYEVLELPYGSDSDSIRSNYKRLALRWHPDKHQNSPDATKKFQLISAAYKRLTCGGQDDDDGCDDDEVVMTMPDMFQLFQQIFFAKAMANAYNGYDSSDDDDDDDSSEEDDIDYARMLASQIKIKSDLRKPKPDTSYSSKHLTPEEIKKNAEELLEEEEKEKRKAEKRRAKKKRRREKKRLEKITAEQEKKEVDPKSSQKKDQSNKEKGKTTTKKSDKNKKEVSGSAEEADFDPHAEFFKKVVSKKKKGAEVPQTSNKKDKKDGKQNLPQSSQSNSKNMEDAEDLDPLVLRSRQLAIRGNEMANLGHYNEAIDLFTEAIKLDSSDFRFFGNRSYCYDRVQQYEKALRDAEKAIGLSPDWPKGYFRKGRAFAGLKLNADAEQAFMHVLKLDRNCEDAMQELRRVRTQKLMEMGFSQKQAESAIRQYGTVQAALDSLLAGVAESALPETYQSDDEDFVETPASPPVFTQLQFSDTKMDPNNPEGLTALWVGNVLPEVSEKKLTQMFSKYGTVTSVRCLPEKYCAFVNFKHKDSAGRAMQTLQGIECAGQHLLIKFPDNPIQNGNVVIKKGTTVTKKSNPSNTIQAPVVAPPVGITPPTSAASGVRNTPKQTGPVNGDECYFWRTTGCNYGDKCHYKHVPEHKGIDRKPWQAVK